jgi:pyridoxal phosphate enzyme (YggS family)
MDWSDTMANVEGRLAEIKKRMARAAEASGRSTGEVRLIAVSKTFEPDAIEPLVLAGQRDFGENRVQEAQRKWPALRERFPDLRLHLIGPLQTNKAREAIELFDVIHSVDRDKLAAALAKELRRETARTQAFLVQVNTGEEPQKAGVPPVSAADFVRRCRDVYRLPIEGLMCIPPEEEDPAPHFAALRDLAGQVKAPALSMGMSGDFEAAIAQGATYVRVGSAIFGGRS